MKTALILIVLGCFTCTGAFAQDTLRVAPPKVAQVILEKLDYELALTAEQENKVNALLLERSEKFAQIRQASQGKELTKASFLEANQQAISKLKQLLTPEQDKRLQLLRQEAQQQKAFLRDEDIYKSL